ncbi:MAG: SGNH/GDSL hydrolase family protein [Marmoricola sp.]
MALLVYVPVQSAHATAPAAPGYCTSYVAEAQQRTARVTGSGRRITVLGDSYALGIGLRDKSQDWVSTLQGRVSVFAFGGSGFAASASPCGPQYSIGGRAAQAMASRPEVVVVEGGINDTGQTADQITDGFAAVSTAVGRVPLIVVGPAAPPSRAVGARRVDRILRRLAEADGDVYVSMVDEPFTYVGPRFIHLTQTSHREYGARVAAAIASLPAPGPQAHPSGHEPAEPSTRGRAGPDPLLVIGIGAVAALLVALGVARALRRR